MNETPGLPLVAAVIQTGDHVIIEAHVPPDLPFLEGHFEDAPIVAGVVQLFWVAHYAREYLQIAGEFCGMEQLKFQRLLRPMDTFTLRIDRGQSGGMMTFSMRNAKQVFSSGRLLFGG